MCALSGLILRFVGQGCTNLGGQVAVATKLFMVAPNICRF
jgi:hypothetical protein